MDKTPETIRKLGPAAGRSIAVLSDLGMTDALIARYFSIDHRSLSILREKDRLSSTSPRAVDRPKGCVE